MIGWTLRDGLWRNDSVEASADAIMRGGSMAFDPATLGTVTLPWSDGSGDLLRHTPILPVGTVVGTMEETDYGFRFPCSGPITEIAIVDSRDETMWGLHNGLGSTPGAKVIWTMPASQVKDDGDGIWKPKRSTLSGCEFDVCVQPRSLTDLEDDGVTIAGTRPAWAAGAAMVYGRGKANNLLHADGTRHKCYSTGKEAQFPAHFACFWKDGLLVGRVTGWYEWDAANSQLVKCLPLAECMVFVNAGAVTVSIDDTVGYTSDGASTAAGRTVWAFGVWAPSSAGTATDVNIRAYDVSAGVPAKHMGIYNDSASDTDPVGAALLTNGTTNTASLGTTTPAWVQFTYTTGPSIETSQFAWFFIAQQTGTATNILVSYDGSATGYTMRSGSFAQNPLPNPMPTTTLRLSSSIASVYATYTGGGGPVKARYLHLSKMRMQ